MKIASTLIVGAGGIGSHLGVPLARLLAYHENARPVVRIVDGDTYEAKNSERQMFPGDSVGRPKSMVLHGQMAHALPDMIGDRPSISVNDEHGYVASSEDAASLMLRCMNDKGFIHESVQHRYGDNGGVLLVCLCVDNDATRRLFYDAIELMPIDHRTIIMIDCGNDLETSTVVTSIWSGRKSQLANPVDVYANLKDPKDRVPGGGCLDMAPSTPQLMLANMSAAFGALLTVQAILDGAGWTDVVMSNIRKFSVGIAGGEYGF